MHEQYFDLPHPDYTPEQKAAICAEFKKKFLAENPNDGVEDDEPVYPMEEVWAELLGKLEVWKKQKEGTA